MHKAEPSSKIDVGPAPPPSRWLGGTDDRFLSSVNFARALARGDRPQKTMVCPTSVGSGIFIMRCDAAGVMSNLCHWKRRAGLDFGSRFIETKTFKWHQVRQICLTWLIYPCPAGRGHPSPKMSPSVFIMSHEGAKAGGGRGSGMPGSY